MNVSKRKVNSWLNVFTGFWNLMLPKMLRTSGHEE